MTDKNDSPRDIEDRIHGTQKDLKKDIDALETKMSPENLKAQARERVDDATEQIKERAVDTTRQAGEAVRDRIDEAGERIRTSDRMPSLPLIGLAAVIGIGLLLVRSSRHRDHDEGHYTRHPRSDYAASTDRPPARTSSYPY